MRTSGLLTSSATTDHQYRIEKEEREEAAQRHNSGWEREREKKKFFSSFCLQSQVTENRNGKCRSKCNFPLQAAVRPGAREVACPGELFTLQ